MRLQDLLLPLNKSASADAPRDQSTSNDIGDSRQQSFLKQLQQLLYPASRTDRKLDASPSRDVHSRPEPPRASTSTLDSSPRTRRDTDPSHPSDNDRSEFSSSVRRSTRAESPPRADAPSADTTRKESAPPQSTQSTPTTNTSQPTQHDDPPDELDGAETTEIVYRLQAVQGAPPSSLISDEGELNLSPPAELLENLPDSAETATDLIAQDSEFNLDGDETVLDAAALLASIDDSESSETEVPLEVVGDSTTEAAPTSPGVPIPSPLHATATEGLVVNDKSQPKFAFPLETSVDDVIANAPAAETTSEESVPESTASKDPVVRTSTASDDHGNLAPVADDAIAAVAETSDSTAPTSRAEQNALEAGDPRADQAPDNHDAPVVAELKPSDHSAASSANSSSIAPHGQTTAPATATESKHETPDGEGAVQDEFIDIESANAIPSTALPPHASAARVPTSAVPPATAPAPVATAHAGNHSNPDGAVPVETGAKTDAAAGNGNTASPTISAPPRGATPAERAQFIEKLIQSMQSAQDQGRELRVQLNPPELGRMEISVESGEAGLSARLLVASAEAHRLLTEHLPQLRDALQHLGAAIDRIDVQLNDAGQGDTPPEDNRRDGSSQQQGQSNHQGERGDSSNSRNQRQNSNATPEESQAEETAMNPLGDAKSTGGTLGLSELEINI